METKRVGIIMNGVTGRMGTNQHLIRSILAIIKQGGVKVSPDLTHHARSDSHRVVMRISWKNSPPSRATPRSASR